MGKLLQNPNNKTKEDLANTKSSFVTHEAVS